MMKIKKTTQIILKAEAVKEIEDKLSSQEKIVDNDPVPVNEEWTDDPVRWNMFKNRYEDEFENKLSMMDSLMTKKRGKLKVTWISIFKKDK